MGGWQPRVGRPLLPGPARTLAAWVTAGCAVLVAALGVLFAHQGTADGFDRAIDAPVIGWLSGQPHLRLWLAWPGTITPAFVLVVAVAAGCLRTGRLNGALLAGNRPERRVERLREFWEAVTEPPIRLPYMTELYLGFAKS